MLSSKLCLTMAIARMLPIVTMKRAGIKIRLVDF